MIQSLRGMKDIIFEDSQRFNFIIDTASKVAKRYGFEYIETPLLEETALFKRSVGESSDIVGKEMYQFIDKGKNDVCLRPEGTAGVVRAFIQHKLDRQQKSFKFFYYGAMFRYERPQKGRFREFHQFGVESFGEGRVEEDFAIISMIKDIFDELGVGYKIKINSLGCSECMPKYRESLIENLEAIRGGLCQDCQRRIGSNPIRVLDCKNSSCQELLSSSPKIVDSLCDSCRSDFERLKRLLEINGIEFEVDKNLVRGLDYYTKSAFEFVSDSVGSQNAIAGGGRYDRLVEFLGGRATPAVGFAIGIERIMELVELPERKREGYYIGAMIKEGLDEVIMVASKLRGSHKVEIAYDTKSLKAHLKGADRVGARYALIIGEDELKNETIWLKDMESKSESIKSIEEII